MQNQNVRGLVERFSEKISADFEATKLDVLVLGPSMGEESPGSMLRSYLYRRAEEEFGAAVTGEFKELVKAYRAVAGSAHNLCDYEERLAERVDAIILIPDSAGSFTELGLFVPKLEIYDKTILLFNREYSRKQSFVNLGPKRVYEQRGARVHNIDFADLDGAWTRVKAFLEERHVDKVIETRKLGS